MNTITVTGKGSFDDTVLQSGKIERRLGLISDELPTDTLTFYVYKQVAKRAVQYLLDKNLKPLVSSDGKFLMVHRSGGGTIDTAKPGDVITVSYTGSDNHEVQFGEFFIESVETVNDILYKFNCYTYLGILNKSIHEGGVYTNKYVLDLIDEIAYAARAQGWNYVADPAIQPVGNTVSGWLPYGNAKDNLLHVLFATGWILVPDHGSARQYILTLPGRKTTNLTDRKLIYSGGGIARLDRAETVRLVEHSYFSSQADILKTLFDNTTDPTAANSAVIVFDEPCHDLDTTGTLQIVPGLVGDNYAVVSGKGTLTGYAYSHSQRQLEADTDVINNGKVISVENETLVSFTNSKNVLARLVNNQNAERSVSVGFRPIYAGNYYYNQVGDIVTFTDIGGVKRTGYITRLDYNMSANPKFNVDLSLGFTPGPYGMNVNVYESFANAGEYTWKVPANVTEITAVLIQGGSGGHGGDGGEIGGDGTSASGLVSEHPVAIGGRGGNGGNGGQGGDPGKINIISLVVTPGSNMTINVGSGGIGGEGGARNGGAGDAGTAGEETTITIGGTTYSSANGSILPSGYSNPLSGNVYGVQGLAGQQGGNGGSASEDATLPTGDGCGENGYDNLKTFNGDANIRTKVYINAYGGGGGGGVAGEIHEAATNGLLGMSIIHTDQTKAFVVSPGYGGDGASADDEVTLDVSSGNGGTGGNGGGGGGGGGSSKVTWEEGDLTSRCTLRTGYGGNGGEGGGGGDGADGGVIIYYSTNS